MLWLSIAIIFNYHLNLNSTIIYYHFNLHTFQSKAIIIKPTKKKGWKKSPGLVVPEPPVPPPQPRPIGYTEAPLESISASATKPRSSASDSWHFSASWGRSSAGKPRPKAPIFLKRARGTKKTTWGDFVEVDMFFGNSKENRDLEKHQKPHWESIYL